MAVRGGNKMGKGNEIHGKGDGTGAQTIDPPAAVGDNQTDQLQDHVANRGGG